jgi:hypothetical protein
MEPRAKMKFDVIRGSDLPTKQKQQLGAETWAPVGGALVGAKLEVGSGQGRRVKRMVRQWPG